MHKLLKPLATLSQVHTLLKQPLYHAQIGYQCTWHAPSLNDAAVLNYFANVGNYTECQCNVNHALCVNLKCATDTTCQRVTTMTNNRITGDDMFCSQNRSHDMPCYNSALRAGDQILVRYCCGDPYCNANNTYLFEFITSQLGVF